MAKANVEAAVSDGRARLSEETGVTAARVIEELGRIAFVDPAAVFDVDGNLRPIRDWDEDSRRALSGCDVLELPGMEFPAIVRKVRFWSKTSALELIGKHLAMWTERINHSGEVRFRFVDPGEAGSADKWAGEDG